ncbi:MAG: DUF2252 family protein [Betaproteobacteria bacterium]|nr:DUF2252 family protein [Betaproteobacteria bacterium]
MPRPVDSILTYNAGRDPERLAMKYRHMRSSAFVFLRATCHLFPAQLPQRHALPASPAVWSCGDLHLENFGSYKGDNRLPYFDVNDFDEGALIPAAWDLLRLLTSVRLACQPLDFDAARVRALLDALLAAYFGALRGGSARWIERETAEGPVRELFDTVRGRERADFLDSRTSRRGRHRRLKLDGSKALPADEAEHRRVGALLRRFAATSGRPDFFEVLDVARRIAGNGSLGVRRWVVLVQGKGAPDGHYLLDLKEALPSALTPALRLKQPPWADEAERVVALAQRCQAVPPAFLHAVRMGGRSYVLRDLQPSADRVAFGDAKQPPERLLSLMASVGRCTAWAHLRASGRQRSAIADELIAWGADADAPRRLRRASRECMQTVRDDWKAYCRAYDDGVFALDATVSAR